MRYRSTRDACAPTDLETALFRGLAPDGGLYLPEQLPALRRDLFAGKEPSLVETAFAVMRPFVEELPEEDLREICAEALDFDVPLVELEEGIRVLELFHGPTLAFKDVGARFMARLMGWFLRESGEAITVLVATSGDTGSAVAHAFFGVPNTRVVILYPRGKVSPLQEKQFTTLGGNVQALAVEGTFDDCQRMAKEAFADETLRREARMTSANSINVGRLLPQAIYYVRAAAAMPEGVSPLFCTPSGNFGNLCAGLIAKRMGMPCSGFVAATNVNDVVPQYLETGAFTPRPSRPTLSNAMDVGDPSNFARILDLYGGDHAAVRADVRGSRWDDDATRAAIREVHTRSGYVLDPHTAVGYRGMQEARREGEVGILLATAHPAKFREHVEPVIGEEVPLPPALAGCLERESRAKPIAAETPALKELLRGRPDS